MNLKTHSFRSPLGRVRGLGSARSGTKTWYVQRLTSLALIPLSLYIIASFFAYAVFEGYEGALYWLRSPFNTTFVILFLVVGFHHSASGLQSVIEDYIHSEGAKFFILVGVKFVSAALAILGILAAVKILFGV